ncbi:MAG: glycosyltransferase, partial [Cytophagales bacterium]
INATLLGIGGAVPMYVSEIKRAPVFLQKNYLEWLFRLIQEPKRLWKRYLVTNTLFIYYVTIEILKNKLFNKS